MDPSGVPTPQMDWDSANLPDAWRRFVQHVKLMFTGPLKEKEEATQCSYLLLWVGERGRDIYNTWTLTSDEAKKLDTYYTRFEEYLMPKTNTIFARYKFNERLQGEGESFEHFVTELNLLVKQCGYANSEEMVRDRIVFASNLPHVRDKLLNQGSDLTLDKAIDIARSYEIAQDQLKTMVAPRSSFQAPVAAHAIFSKRRHTQQKNTKWAAVTTQRKHAGDVRCSMVIKRCVLLKGKSAKSVRK